MSAVKPPMVPEGTFEGFELQVKFLRSFVKFTVSRCLDAQDLKDRCLSFLDLEGVREIDYTRARPRMERDNTAVVIQNKFEIGGLYSDLAVMLAYQEVSRSSGSHNSLDDGLVVEFIDSLLEILKDVFSLDDELVDPLNVKPSLKRLQVGLRLLRNFLVFTSRRCTLLEQLTDLFVHAKVGILKSLGALFKSTMKRYILRGKLNYLLRHSKFVADNAAYLCYQSLFKLIGQELVDRFVLDLSHLVEEIDPGTPKVRKLYIGILSTYSESMQLSTCKSYEIAAEFVEFFLERGMELLSDGLIIPVKDQIQILIKELVFLWCFLKDPPSLDTDTLGLGNLLNQCRDICAKVGSVVLSLYGSEKQEETLEKVDLPLVGLLEELEVLKLKISKVYAEIPKPPCPKLPSTDELGFLDCFLGNLKELLNTDLSRFLKLPTEPFLEDLLFLKSFLCGTAEQHRENEKLAVLRSRTVAFATSAEYIVESLLVKNGPMWYLMLWLSEVTEEIRVLKAQINKIYEMNMDDSEVHSSAKVSYQHSSEATTPEMDNTDVGFQDEGKNLVEELVNGSVKRIIVSIVGMPGQGKTHLAKRTFNNPVVKDHFHVSAWCYISQMYNRRHLLTSILCQIAYPVVDISEMEEEELAEIVYKELKGMRYLIVLDDMWDVEPWVALRRSFPDDSNGSRIMFTSRSSNLDLEMSAQRVYHLRKFSNDECWCLLEEKLFQKEKCPAQLLQAGKKIARRCNGLPLIVVLVAGILARIDKERPQWMEVAKNLSSFIFGDSMKAIELSYNHLPNCLKSCFLYIGAFHGKGYIRVEKLIRLWIAEGFVHKVEPKSLECVAKDYLMDLIGRNLLIIAEKSSSGNIKRCRVHDLVYDFCLEKAKDENFLQHVTSFSRDTIYEQCRISCKDPKRLLKLSPSGQYVQSLLFINDSYSSQRLDRVSSISRIFKLLRVLDLEAFPVGNYFPCEITSLVLLRYLALYCEGLRSLPPSIANLWNLSSLIVKGYSKVELPHTIWKMVKLRHLHIGGYITFGPPHQDNASQLDNLQSMSTLELTKEDDVVATMKGLANIKNLKCRVSTCCELLGSFSQLESLKMDTEFEFPTFELRLPLNLKKLTLSRFGMPWTKISMIGKLPNLEVLKLNACAFSGEVWEIGDGEFPKLKFLKLKDLDIKQWTSSSGYCPPLEQLVINCGFLKEIPCCLGDIPTLKMIKIMSRTRNGSLRERVKQIQEEQLDMGNEEFKVNWFRKKAVVKVAFHNDEDKTKALNAVTGIPGVHSISMNMGEEAANITVSGDMDPVVLVSKLRRLWHTELVSVGEEAAKDMDPVVLLRKLRKLRRSWRPELMSAVPLPAQ